MAQKCLHCNQFLPSGTMRYLVSDLGEEMLAWVELKLKNEVTELSCICEECFISFGSSWAAIQEEKVLSLPSAMEGVSFDPLSGVQMPLEVVKVEVPEHLKYDYEIKLETPTIQNTTVEPNDNSMNMKIDQEVSSDEDDIIIRKDSPMKTEIVVSSDEDDNIKKDTPMKTEIAQEVFSDKDDIRKVKCSDDEWRPSDEDDITKDENSDNEWSPAFEKSLTKKRSQVPPLQKATRLSSEFKCAWCLTQLDQKSFRILQDGPAESSEGHARQSSPQIVCDVCWTKKEKNIEDPSKIGCSIALPGYKRVVKGTGRCFVHDCTTKKMHRKIIPEYLRRVLLKSYNVFVSQKCRSCEEHMKEYYRDWSFLKQGPLRNDFSTADVTEMLDLLRDYALKLPE